MAKIMDMPKIGVNMTEAQIVRWVVAEGDHVDEGQHILDAETDKAVQEIYSAMSGTIAKIIAQEGDKVEILKPIAVVTQKSETVSDSDIIDLIADNAGSSLDNTPGKRVKISPLAKKIAKQMGIDYMGVKPSVEGARICKEDILRFAEQAKKDEPVKKSTEQPQTRTISVDIDNTRRTIMNKMNESNSTKPTVPLTLYADMTKFINWRGELKESGNNVNFTAMLALGVSRVIKDFPMINSHMISNGIETIEQVNIGIAADTEKGLIVPVICDCDKKGVLQIGAELSEKLERIKSGKINADDITGGTFTISNLGMFEIESFDPIINPPECCILGVGAIIKKPVVVKKDGGDSIEIRPMMSLTLCFDHRIVDGAPAARFLQKLKHAVENPMLLLN